MRTTYTRAGTPIVDMSSREYLEYLDQQVRDYMNMSLVDFIRLKESEQIDWDHPWAFFACSLVGPISSAYIHEVQAESSS